MGQSAGCLGFTPETLQLLLRLLVAGIGQFHGLDCDLPGDGRVPGLVYGAGGTFSQSLPDFVFTQSAAFHPKPLICRYVGIIDCQRASPKR